MKTKDIILRPTHVILSTSMLIGAWSDCPVAKVDTYFDGQEFAVVVLLVEPDEAASRFTERNKRHFNKDWEVDANDVVAVYGNKHSNHRRPWLNDDALIGIIEDKDLDELVPSIEWSITGNGINPHTAEFLVSEFCTCQSLEWHGEVMYYGVKQCPVHGPYNPHNIVSCLSNTTLTVRMAAEFERDDQIEPLTDLDGSTIYGWGDYFNGEPGVYLSFSDEKFKTTYKFIPASRFATENMAGLIAEYPEIGIRRT